MKNSAQSSSSTVIAEGNLLFQQYVFPDAQFLEVLDEEPNHFKTK